MLNDKHSIAEQSDLGNSLFDDPKNVKRLLYILYGCCGVLLLLDFVIHRHVIHSWEYLWGFYPLFGFIGCVVLVLVATQMRKFLMRSENYYADIDNIKNNLDKGENNVDA